MLFAIGDKVVHPRFGAGLVTALADRELPDGPTHYYVIEVPAQRLTVQVPVLTAAGAGMRRAMSNLGAARVLAVLGGKPRPLPLNFRERQEQMGSKLRTGRVTQLIRVVRDLTWHSKHARLTNVDGVYLKQGIDQLAAEIALVSGQTISDTNKQIGAALATPSGQRPIGVSPSERRE